MVLLLHFSFFAAVHYNESSKLTVRIVSSPRFLGLLLFPCCRLSSVIFFVDIIYGHIFRNFCPLGGGKFIPSINVIYNTPKTSLQTADVSPGLSLLRDVSRGRTSATQRQKFHTDDVKQCLHSKSCSHGVPNENLFNFTFLLVDFGQVLCSFATKLQQNSNASSRETYIPPVLTVLV